MTTTTNNETNATETLDDLEITKAQRRQSCGGTWVRGTIAGHRFDALVFADHAEREEIELGRSRITKLWIQRLADRATVANFDRGWDVKPQTDLAATLVDHLADGLAELVLGK